MLTPRSTQYYYREAVLLFVLWVSVNVTSERWSVLWELKLSSLCPTQSHQIAVLFTLHNLSCDRQACWCFVCTRVHKIQNVSFYTKVPIVTRFPLNLYLGVFVSSELTSNVCGAVFRSATPFRNSSTLASVSCLFVIYNAGVRTCLA